MQTYNQTLNVSLQVHYDTWRHPTDVQSRGQTTSFAYRLLPQSLQDAYADRVARLTLPTNGQVSSNNQLMTCYMCLMFCLGGVLQAIQNVGCVGKFAGPRMNTDSEGHAVLVIGQY